MQSTVLVLLENKTKPLQMSIQKEYGYSKCQRQRAGKGTWRQHHTIEHKVSVAGYSFFLQDISIAVNEIHQRYNKTMSKVRWLHCRLSASIFISVPFSSVSTYYRSPELRCYTGNKKTCPMHALILHSTQTTTQYLILHSTKTTH